MAQQSGKRRTAGGTHARGARRAVVRNKHVAEGAVQTVARPAITRRRFLVGAGAAAVAAVGAGAAASRCSAQPEEPVEPISVPEDAVFDLNDCTQVEAAGNFEQVGQFDLPFGTLVFCSDPTVAIALSPTDEASPLVTVSALHLGSGYDEPLLGGAHGADEGFEVVDARGNALGLVWTEANVFAGTWRVLCASLHDGGDLGAPRIVDEGGAGLQTPTLAAVGGRAYWTVMPTASSDDAATGRCLLKRATFTAGDAQTAYEAAGRMPCPIYGADGRVAFAVRHPGSSRTYQLLCLDNETGGIHDKLTLPTGMRPDDIGWGRTGFSFSFEGIYNYGDGIANLGTYTPAATAGSGYDGQTWFRFSAAPTAQPAWCGRWFIVKGRYSVCAVDVDQRAYCSLGSVSGSTSWGDYLATNGTQDRIVSYSQIDQTTTGGQREQSCIVRVWQPTA